MHYWWPKNVGPALSRRMGTPWAAAIIFVRVSISHFFRNLCWAYLGMAAGGIAFLNPAEFSVFERIVLRGALRFLGVGYLIPLIYFIWSMRYGPVGRLESMARKRASSGRRLRLLPRRILPKTPRRH